MDSAATFRQYINWNKKAVLDFLKGKPHTSTRDIQYGYNGEKEISAVRKALRELKNEGKVEDEIRGVNTKYWKLCAS